MFNKPNIIVSVSILSMFILYITYNGYFINTSVKKDMIQKKDFEIATSINERNNKEATIIAKPKKIEYSKVVLPDEIRSIEHELVDMKNQLALDKYNLDKEVKQSLKYSNLDDEIKKAKILMEDMNVKLDLSKKEIGQLNNTYTRIMQDKINTPKSKAIENEILNIDKTILKIEKDMNILTNGEF